MSENRDYYEVLGVDKDADARTIKRAFLKKARTVPMIPMLRTRSRG